MSARIKIGEMTATCDHYHWKASSPELERLLNAMLDPLGPSGADPNPDYHAALKATELLGGEVVSYDSTEYEEGVVY